MSELAKSAEIRIKRGEQRTLTKVYIDGKELPWYCTPDSTSVRPHSGIPTARELTVTFLIDGPVVFNTVSTLDSDGEL